MFLEESYFLPPTNSCLPKSSIPFPLFYSHGNVTSQQWDVLFYNFPRIAHFTVTCENEAGVDLLLLQPFLLYCVDRVVLSLTIFQA